MCTISNSGKFSVRIIRGGRSHWVGGGTMASAWDMPIMRIWGQSHQQDPWADPLVRGKAIPPPEAESSEAYLCLKEGPKHVAKMSIPSKYLAIHLAIHSI